ncbi:MAG: cytochrome c peroxidase [Piscinibacter sp.]
MRRLMTSTWLLGSLLAASAALVVTLAHAAPGPAASLADGWSKDELAVLASLSLRRLPPMPADASNAYERLPAAISFGQRLFADARLSSNGAVSCASCHDPRKQFQDGLPLSRGVGTGSRRAMPIVGAGYSSWLFWDGRKDSLWSQALGPLEDGVEHGGNRTRYARLLASNHRQDYEAVFGAMPALDGLPADAGPNGSAPERAAWATMDARQRNDVSRIFANMGKAIAAYEKSLQHEPSRLDRYVDAVVAGRAAGAGILRPDEVRGLRLFIGKGQCVTCHNGPLLSDQQFHNTGVPPRDPARPDRGRADATAKVRSDEFNCLGPFSDAQPTQCQELRFMVDDDAALVGAFKTPGLRGVAQRAPYMHAGQLATLDQVVRHYVAAPHAAVGHSELTHRHAGGNAPRHDERAPIELNDGEAADLVSFLGTLNNERPASPAPTAPATSGAAHHLGHTELPQRDGGTTTLFYPTAATESPVRQGPFEHRWAEDAEPRRGNGRLVVISHGSGGSPWVHVDLARVLVERGFTVALPQHAGDNHRDPSTPGPSSWARRPIEVSQAIDGVASHRRLAPLLELDAVGIFGGSAGGHTALSLAGGAWSASRFRDHCLRHIEQDFSSCVGFLTLQRGDGLDGIKAWLARLVIRLRFSDDTVQQHTDPRIGAVVAMVPFAADFDPGSLRQPRVPLGLVIADQDINQVPRFHVEAVRAACEPRCELLMRLPEAGHGAMLSPLPPFEPGSVAQRLLADPPSFDRPAALPALHARIAAFFERHLGAAT